jgi:hypothetical protein
LDDEIATVVGKKENMKSKIRDLLEKGLNEICCEAKE